MDKLQIPKSTQEQAVASWIDHLNQLRFKELIATLFEQDKNLEGALNQLQTLRDFTTAPEHILGNVKTKHGEIAENAQVYIANARRIIDGLPSEYTFEGVGRTAPEDYLFNGLKVQSKYLNGLVNTLTSKDGVLGHMQKYPNFINEGGIYHIPKDQYEAMQTLLSMSDEQFNKASREVRYAIIKLREFEQQSGIQLNSGLIKPAIATYGNVQPGRIDETINREEQSINDRHEAKREEAHQLAKPSVQEGVKAAAASAAIEGGVSFCLAVYTKLQSGKKIAEFTTEDWKDIGIATASGGGKGAIRGAAIYGMTNFSATPAAVASALVTATFGMAHQAMLLRQGKISRQEFIVNSKIVCLEVSVSAISSLMGQVFIPIPVFGAVVGNAAGMFMYGIAKNNLSQQEQLLINEHNRSMQQLRERLDLQHISVVETLLNEFAKFESIIELALSPDVNIRFAGSIALAQHVGCDRNKILDAKEQIDDYFLR